MQLGIDRLIQEKFRRLRGLRIGLCTNSSCCDSHLTPTFHIFARQKIFSLKALFAPEHGIYASLQDQIKTHDYYDNKRRIIISSLYGHKLRPNSDVLEKIDTLVIDLQDIGTRYYTFAWSALLMIQECARLNKSVVILDRPNPLNGLTVQGPVLEPQYSSFVGLYPIPVRHAMTIAELCLYINHQYRLGATIDVIPMKGWKRQHYFDDTGLKWTVPSPNMPTLETALVYPGMCLLEGTNISEGRGTTHPFEIFGAPWIEADVLVKKLSRAKIPGVLFRQAYFVPTFSKYKGMLCNGAQLYVANRKKYDSFTTGLEIIRIIKTTYPSYFAWKKPPYEFETKKYPFDILAGNSWIRKGLEHGVSVASLKQRWSARLNKFKHSRTKYLLYT